MSVDSGHDTQQPCHGFVPDCSQIMLLRQLLERSRTSEENATLIARQLSELSRTVGTIMERGAAPIADTYPSPSTSLPAATPGPSPVGAKRIGAPGTFQPPVWVPVPKSASMNEFHVSFTSYALATFVLTELG